MNSAIQKLPALAFLMALAVTPLKHWLHAEDRSSAIATLTLPSECSLPIGPITFFDLFPVDSEDKLPTHNIQSDFVITHLTGKSSVRIRPALIQAAYRAHFNQALPILITGSSDINLAYQNIAEADITQAIHATLPATAESIITEKGTAWAIPATTNTPIIQARCLHAKSSGKTAFVVTATDRQTQKEIARTLYHGAIAYYQSVPIALRSIKAGEMLSENNTTMQRIPAQAPTPEAGRISFLGKQTKQAIDQGTIITKHMLIKPWPVNARARVTIQWRSDHFVLTSHGIALTNGDLGEVVQIKGQNGNKLTALVVGPNVVQIGNPTAN